MGYIKHRQRVMQVHQAKCWVCGRIGSEIDHVVPRSLGGSDAIANLRPICPTCNKNRNQADHPFGYAKIPPVEKVVAKGSIWIYRRRIELVPKMYRRGSYLLAQKTIAARITEVEAPLVEKPSRISAPPSKAKRLSAVETARAPGASDKRAVAKSSATPPPTRARRELNDEGLRLLRSAHSQAWRLAYAKGSEGIRAFEVADRSHMPEGIRRESRTSSGGVSAPRYFVGKGERDLGLPIDWTAHFDTCPFCRLAGLNGTTPAQMLEAVSLRRPRFLGDAHSV